MGPEGFFVETGKKQTEETPGLRPYTPPNLTVFGDVSKLTAAGLSTVGEAGNNAAKKHI